GCRGGRCGRWCGPSARARTPVRPPLARTAQARRLLGRRERGGASVGLPFAASEAKAVAAMFAGSRILVRKDASKANFTIAAGAFPRIHFATHGRFDPEAPLSSGLYLAGAGGSGMLTVGELYSMRLDSDLVTLSACETGLGKIASGDDV